MSNLYKTPRAARVWVPSIERSVFDPVYFRDLLRMQTLWAGELVVHTLPELNAQKVTWPINAGSKFQVAAIGSEQLNAFHVIHVDRRGNFNPCYPHLPAKVPHYAAWLNAECRLLPDYRQINLLSPMVEGGTIALSAGEIVMREQRTDVRLGDYFPTAYFKNKTSRLIIDPTSELHPDSAKLHRACDVTPEKQEVLLDDEGQVIFRQFGVYWPEPFKSLFQMGSNCSTVHIHARVFRTIIKLADQGQWRQALNMTSLWYQRYSFLSPVTWGQAYGSPKLGFDREEIVLSAEAKLNRSFANLPDFIGSEQEHALWESDAGMAINCVGWVGLFFYQLYSDLMARVRLGTCINLECGRIFKTSRLDQLYCSRKECRRARTLARVRSHRAKESKNGKEAV